MDHYRTPNSESPQKTASTAAKAGSCPLASAYSADGMRTFEKALLAALLCLSATTARGEGGPPLAWACWLSEQIPVSIKCIRDRSIMRHGFLDDKSGKFSQNLPDAGENPGLFSGKRNLPQLIEQYGPENEIEAEVLNEIYSKILIGNTSRLDDLVKRHAGSLRENSILTINIYTFPLEASWQENLPVKIVRSALCPKKPNCRVILNKPDY